MIWWGPLLQGGANQLSSLVEITWTEVVPGAAASGITGTLSVTEDGDTLSSNSSLSISATLSVTEASDTLTSTGALALSGSLSVTESSDTLSSGSSLSISGSLSVTESSDTLSSNGSSGSTGSLSVTEADDTLSSQSNITISGSLSSTEISDTLTSQSNITISGSASITEASDTVYSSGSLFVSGSLSVTEDSDTLSSSGSLLVSGSLSVTEADDTLSSNGSSETPATVSGVSSTGSAGDVTVSFGAVVLSDSVSSAGSVSEVTVDITFTYARPDEDIEKYGWTGSPDNVDLYKNIDEFAPSDADYIQSPPLEESPGPVVFGIDQELVSGRTYSVRTRARATGGVGQIRALVLSSTGTTVGTSAWQQLTSSFTTYDLLITTTGVGDRVELEVQD